MKIYIISDTHFNHEAIKNYCGRPNNHEELLWKNLYRITKNDILIHLGDICMGNDVQENFSIAQLACRKVLVMGNHDTKSWSWYMDHGWDFVCDSFKLKYGGRNICFSHKPQPWDGDWDLNIHGHLHNLGAEDNAKKRPDEFHNLKQWHRLYAPELMNYEPVELTKFIQEK